MSSTSRKRKQQSSSVTQPNSKRMRLSTSLARNVQLAMDNNTFHDVEFIVGRSPKQQTFSGSRIFFAIHSPVLEKMLYSNMLEGNKNNNNNQSSVSTVIIPDVTPSAFRYFKLLVYSYNPQLDYNICIDVLYLSRKYLMDSLTSECKHFILSVSESSDFYKILNSFGRYTPNTFNLFLTDFLQNSKYSKLNKNYSVSKMIKNNNFFAKLSINITIKIIKSTLLRTQQSKYIYCKQYCINNVSNSDSDIDGSDNSDWRTLFKKHFESFIDFSLIKSDYLLSTIRSDNILTVNELLDICYKKTLKNKPGFNIENMLITYEQSQLLQNGDMCDIRCCNGEIVPATIITRDNINYNNNNNNNSPSVNNNEVCCVYNAITNDFAMTEFVSFDDERLLKHNCISNRLNITKICMQNLKKDQHVFVNMAYQPSKAYYIDNQWIECKIIGFWKNQVKVASIGDKIDGDYYFHPDSKDEIACSLECEYCCAN